MQLETGDGFRGTTRTTEEGEFTSVGASGELLLDKVSGRLTAGDRLMLCSDGVFKAVPEAEIAAMLAAGTAAEVLVETAVARGARDNVSAVMLRLDGDAPDERTDR